MADSISTETAPETEPIVLTIEGQSKIEAGLANRENKRKGPSRLSVIFKWLMTLFLGVLMLGFVSVSKVSVIGLSELLNNTKESSDPSQRETSSRAFVMLLWVLIVPSLISLLRAAWISFGRKDMPWPNKRTMALGVVISAIEALGLCLFAFRILNMDHGLVVLLLMNGVFLLPIINILWKCIKKRSEPSFLKWLIVFIIALVLEITGIILTIYIVIDDLTSRGTIGQLWHVPVALICLSVTWAPGLQEFLLRPRQKRDDVNEKNTDHKMNDFTSKSDTLTSGSETLVSTGSQSSTMTCDPQKPWEVKKTAIWKMTMWLSLFKIAFFIIFGIVLFYFDNNRYQTTQAAWDDFRSAWNWPIWNREIAFFFFSIVGSLFGYGTAILACSTCLQKGAFAIPLFIATPVATAVLMFKTPCEFVLWPNSGVCLEYSGHQLALIIPAAVCLVLAQVLSTGWLVFRTETIILAKESQIFWFPMYNGILLEQWLLLAKRTKHMDEQHEDARTKAKRTKVYICTTMYRETDYEMKQLMESINRVNLAQVEGDRHFESHVFFDGGVKDTVPSDFVLQLVSMLESTMDVKPVDCTKTLTPYGMSLGWLLPAPRGKKRMIFKIHLKDNLKVKNKKRWSQVMYMSYVLDFQLRQFGYEGDILSDSFILTTDADVHFTPESVEALLDLMTRDRSVGAVCARTHPLGSGPLVWYQVFEYAIGHWFQKAAEHVLGSVLCAPGCFSVYRCKAIREILPIYATDVDHAFDFLIKDMGEDRWFCTLMVQSGWRIEYCAASENSTHCPEEFEEFYKQRRRWVASTIANIMCLLKEWHLVDYFNNRVSVFFLIYQAALLLSTLIGPSTIILVVSGGLFYAWHISAEITVILQFLVCVAFAVICLYTEMDTQLQIAKLLTFLYAVVMTAVTVGTAEQIATEFGAGDGPRTHTAGNATSLTTTPIPTLSPQAISIYVPVSTTTLYLGILSAMFLVTGLVHPREFMCLLHGVWYLLCLPSGYLVLNIYSICNITDRTWGTREAKEVSSIKKEPWHIQARNIMKTVFFCCDQEKRKDKGETDTPAGVPELTRQGSREATINRPGSAMSIRQSNFRQDSDTTSFDKGDTTPGALDEEGLGSYFDPYIPVSVGDWLPPELKTKYAPVFKKYGFENTLFISGMSERELRDIGVSKRGHVQFLLEQIKKLPDYEVETSVPENAKEWLENIGLEQYSSTFVSNQIREAKDMEVLKSFSRKEIERELGVTKPGHVKRLMYAIGKLRNPTDAERRAMEVRRSLENATTHSLYTVNKEEYDFWEKLRKERLQPSSKAFGLEEELKVKLGGLRNEWLMILAVSNTLWLILIMTLAAKGRLTVLGTNPIGLSFLFIFGVIFVVQFGSMWIHRIATLTHSLARAPYIFGHGYNTSWAFRDSDMRGGSKSDTVDQDASIMVREAEGKFRERLERRPNARPNHDDKTPLTV